MGLLGPPGDLPIPAAETAPGHRPHLHPPSRRMHDRIRRHPVVMQLEVQMRPGRAAIGAADDDRPGTHRSARRGRWRRLPGHSSSIDRQEQPDLFPERGLSPGVDPSLLEGISAWFKEALVARGQS